MGGMMVFIDERLDQVGKYIPGGIPSKYDLMKEVKYTFGIWDEGEEYPYTARRCSSLAEAEGYWAEHVENRVDFWNEHLDGYLTAPDKHIVVKDRKYTIYPDSANPKMGWKDGYGGDRRVIRLTNGTKITTRNLWYNGVIPRFYRETMKPNAEFVTREYDNLPKLGKK